MLRKIMTMLTLILVTGAAQGQPVQRDWFYSYAVQNGVRYCELAANFVPDPVRPDMRMLRLFYDSRTRTLQYTLVNPPADPKALLREGGFKLAAWHNTFDLPIEELVPNNAGGFLAHGIYDKGAEHVADFLEALARSDGLRFIQLTFPGSRLTSAIGTANVRKSVLDFAACMQRGDGGERSAR